MAQSAFYSNTNGTGKNASSEVTLDTFAASSDLNLKVDGRLSNLNPVAATFTIIARHTDASGTQIREFFFSEVKRTAADTTFGFSFAPFLIKNGEKVVLRIRSTNASDTNVSWSLDWLSDRSVDVFDWMGTATVAPDTAGYPKVTGKSGSGAGEWSLSFGVINANVTQFGGSAGIFSAGLPEVNVTRWRGSQPAVLAGAGSDLLQVNVTSIPTASQIATAIFTDLLVSNDFSTNGSFGKLVKDNLDAPVSSAGNGSALTQQQVRDAMMLAPTAGAPAANSVDAELDTLLQRTTEGVSVLIGNHIAADGETLTIVQGQTYTTALNNAITINVTDTRLSDAITSDGTIPVLTISNTGRSVTVEGEVAAFDDEDSTATCTFELTRAQTSDIPAGSTGTWELEFKMAGEADDVLTSVIDSPAVIKRQVSE